MPMSNVAVLVVEDVPQVRATAVRIMEDLGCEVFDTYNGHHALKLLQAHPEIEVLFTDVRMPGMSGTELAEAAQRLRPDLRIVLTSGYVGRRTCQPTSPLSQSPGGWTTLLEQSSSMPDPSGWAARSSPLAMSVSPR